MGVPVPRWKRPMGGVLGVVVAVAGGFGAAVGLYDLPSPEDAGVGAEVYLRATQRAVVASTIREDEEGSTVLRIEVTRGADVREHADRPMGGDPNVNEMRRVGVWFDAVLRTCTFQPDFECSYEAGWSANDLPESSFSFGALLDTATFTGEVAGCHFDVVWHPEGEIGPFEDHDQTSGSRLSPPPDQHADAFARARANAELSRVAPADIDMTGDTCFDHERSGAPGYVTQGAGIDTAWADVAAR